MDNHRELIQDFATVVIGSGLELKLPGSTPVMIVQATRRVETRGLD